MTLTDNEVKEALLYMAESGAFPNEVTLSRWAITDEAELHIRYWLAEQRRSTVRVMQAFPVIQIIRTPGPNLAPRSSTSWRPSVARSLLHTSPATQDLRST